MPRQIVIEIDDDGNSHTLEPYQEELPAMPTKTELNAEGTESFILNEDELNALQTARGRKPTQSVYASDVAEALAHPGEVRGLKVTANAKAAWIGSQVRKGFKDAGVDISDYTVYNREEKGFVAFVYSPKVTADV